MKARDIMTSNPECVTSTDTVQQAARIMRDRDIGLVPVVDDPSSCRIQGVITDRDIAVRCVAEGRNGDCQISDLMSSDLVTAHADEDVESIMGRMASEQLRRIPIVEGDRLVGIIAQADIALDIPRSEDVGNVLEKISEPSRRSF